MEPSFKSWLVRHDVTPKVLKTLKKEHVTNDTTLKAMKDSDLQALMTKYKLPMGQYVILRSARDELLKGREAEGHGDSFEELHQPPKAGVVEREVGRGDSVPVLSPTDHSRHGTPRRLRGDEIREKYQLPSRNDKYSKSRAHNNGASAMPSASATPSPLPDGNVRTRTRSPISGGGGDLPVSSQMRELHRKGVERGQKISALEHKSRGLMYGAMDYERMCAQLAENQQSGKKRKKPKKKEVSTVQPHEPTHDIKKTATFPQQSQRRSSSAHGRSTLPPSSTSTPSPHHTPSPYYHPGSHSDPIRKSPRRSDTYGTMSSRPTTPTSMSYTPTDGTLHPHHNEEQELLTRTTNTRRKPCCCCCRTM